MSKLFLLSVGKIKNKTAYYELQEEFLKRINSPKLELIETKAFGEDNQKESSEIIQKINQLSKKPYIILMDEFGKHLTSVELSEKMEKIQAQAQDIFFLIGGAKGHSDELKSISHFKLSMSKLTFPHKLARVMLLEQIYRGQSISRKHPYHNP